MNEEQIASALGISYSTLRRHKASNEQFQAALKKGKALGISDVTSALYAAAVGGNVTAMIYYLKNRSPEDWRDRPDPVHDNDPPPPVKVVIEVVNASLPDADA
ncbi:DNA-binding protein [Bordetella hinzii]|uniref:DNA-binding protein n=1 Tax=Bordetella hinzii TaxID=103855 RepID=UPI001E61E53C|nr:DNA-binding protein [Bordetella hinzii]